MSAYSIARSRVDDALAAADGEGVDAETVLRALVATVVERYREREGAERAREMLTFQLQNVSGEEDYEFMRP